MNAESEARFNRLLEEATPIEKQKVSLILDVLEQTRDRSERDKAMEELEALMHQIVARRKSTPPDPFAEFQECKDKYFATDNLDQKRYQYIELNARWMRINAHRVYDFWWSDQEEAIEEIVAAFRADETVKWTDREYYKQARLLFEDVRRTGHICDPRVMDFFFKRDFADFRRKFYVELAASNDSPKKRRGRPRAARRLKLIKGGWDGKEPDDLPWHAADLYPYKR